MSNALLGFEKEDVQLCMGWDSPYTRPMSTATDNPQIDVRWLLDFPGQNIALPTWEPGKDPFTDDVTPNIPVFGQVIRQVETYMGQGGPPDERWLVRIRAARFEGTEDGVRKVLWYVTRIQYWGEPHPKSGSGGLRCGLARIEARIDRKISET